MLNATIATRMMKIVPKMMAIIGPKMISRTTAIPNTNTNVRMKAILVGSDARR